MHPFSLTRASRLSADSVETAFHAGIKSKTESMMTAARVAGSATTYCHVEVRGSKQAWTVGSGTEVIVFRDDAVWFLLLDVVFGL